MAAIMWGLFIIVGGFAIVYYAADLVGIFGRSSRMERNLGGTRSGYMLFGFLVMVIGFMIMFGVINLSGGVDQATKIHITH